jgi:hypothetical protein
MFTSAQPGIQYQAATPAVRRPSGAWSSKLCSTRRARTHPTAISHVPGTTAATSPAATTCVSKVELFHRGLPREA